MDRIIRCTVCYWRGDWSEAEQSARVSPSEIPPAMETIQAAYEERQAVAATVGQPPPPPCPSCGHHTRVVPRRQSIRPAA